MHQLQRMFDAIGSGLRERGSVLLSESASIAVFLHSIYREHAQYQLLG